MASDPHGGIIIGPFTHLWWSGMTAATRFVTEGSTRLPPQRQGAAQPKGVHLVYELHFSLEAY